MYRFFFLFCFPFFLSFGRRRRHCTRAKPHPRLPLCRTRAYEIVFWLSFGTRRPKAVARTTICSPECPKFLFSLLLLLLLLLHYIREPRRNQCDVDFRAQQHRRYHTILTRASFYIEYRTNTSRFNNVIPPFLYYNIMHAVGTRYLLRSNKVYYYIRFSFDCITTVWIFSFQAYP